MVTLSLEESPSHDWLSDHKPLLLPLWYIIFVSIHFGNGLVSFPFLSCFAVFFPFGFLMFWSCSLQVTLRLHWGQRQDYISVLLNTQRKAMLWLLTFWPILETVVLKMHFQEARELLTFTWIVNNCPFPLHCYLKRKKRSKLHSRCHIWDDFIMEMPWFTYWCQILWH